MDSKASRLWSSFGRPLQSAKINWPLFSNQGRPSPRTTFIDEINSFHSAPIVRIFSDRLIHPNILSTVIYILIGVNAGDWAPRRCPVARLFVKFAAPQERLRPLYSKTAIYKVQNTSPASRGVRHAAPPPPHALDRAPRSHRNEESSIGGEQ